MNFSRLDDEVNKLYGSSSNSELDDQLDLYDIEKLKSIYHQLTGKYATLLKRCHLCNEIKSLYQIYLKRNKTAEKNNELEYRTICSWLVEERSSYRTITIYPDSCLDWNLFDCINQSQFYQKCYDLLLFRSQYFSQFVTETINQSQSSKLEELFDSYFNTFYLNYQIKYRNWLLFSLIGINLIKYHIVKLQLPHNYYYVDKDYNINYWKNRQFCQLICHNDKRFEIKLTYDKEQLSLGIFHLFLPNIVYLPSRLELDDCIIESFKSDDDKSTILSNPEQSDILSYPDRFLVAKSIKYRFTVNVQKNQEDEKMDEVFSKLIKK